jgi:uroporphyrinogen decarboxylase
MHGGIDKRAIAAGPPVIDRELERKIPVALAGGYLPTCDHSMPPDISYENVCYYWSRKKELLGIKSL